MNSGATRLQLLVRAPPRGDKPTEPQATLNHPVRIQHRYAAMVILGNYEVAYLSYVARRRMA
jgi:hypothetical protein